MTLTAGSLTHPEGRHVIEPTPHEEIDAAIAALSDNKQRWLNLPIEDRIFHLEQIMANTLAVAERWVEAACEAKGIDFDASVAGEEWSSGPYLLIRNARLLRDSLRALADGRKPELPAVSTRPDGQVVAKVFPTDLYDQAVLNGFTAEVWMQPGVTPGNLASTQAVAYDNLPSAGVGLVLGAGNISSIAPMDVLTMLFTKKHVALLKPNPVNEYLGPFIAEAFASLIEEGFVRIVYGGTETGHYACFHDGVDTIHITGSDKTYYSIEFGDGEEGEARRARGEPIMTKPVSAELGNVTPVIVVPGPWTTADIEYQAKNLAGMLTHNAGFNCVATRVLLTHGHWKHREALLSAIGDTLTATPTRPAYYPGADDRLTKFLDAHPEARRYGNGVAADWAFITDLDENKDELCFSVEPFAGVFAETPLDAPRSVPDFIEQAVDFCNNNLWGTLAATLIVHPESLKDPVIAAAVEDAIAALRYGTVTVNAWSGIGFLLASTTWGAFPEHTRSDIGSGMGVVHNTYLFDQAQKSVVRAPFKSYPKPLWFAENKQTHQVTRYLTQFEADPQPWKLLPVFAAALAG